MRVQVKENGISNMALVSNKSRGLLLSYCSHADGGPVTVLNCFRAYDPMNFKSVSTDLVPNEEPRLWWDPAEHATLASLIRQVITQRQITFEEHWYAPAS